MLPKGRRGLGGGSTGSTSITVSSNMRFCIFGVGAVGSFVLARLTQAGIAASGVARGETLAAIRARGIRVIGEDGVEEDPVKPVRVSDHPADLGPQDVLFIAMKAHRIAGALTDMAPLIGPDTTVVTAVNGIPWWYFHGLRSAVRCHLDSVDPGGRLWQALDPKRAVGCVVYMGASVPRPGVVICTQPRLVVGEPDGPTGPRLTAIAEALTAAGLDTTVTSDIRAAVWKKVLGNAWANPVSIIAGATADRICSDFQLRPTLIALMAEVSAVAAAYGTVLDVDFGQRIDEAATLGAFKSSTLQDFERGRSIEIDAILGAVGELGRLAGVATPTVDAVYALTRLRADIAGRYQKP